MQKQIDTQNADLIAKEIQVSELEENLESANAKLQVIQETVSPTESESNTETPAKESSKAGVGYVKFTATYPGSGVPAFRICFSDITDISKQYCFWKKHSADTRNYANDLEGDTVSLPAGRYHIDFATYNDSTEVEINNVREIYAMKECVYYGSTEGSECQSMKDELKKYSNGMISPLQIVNYPQYGGKMMTFEVREGKTSILNKFSLFPV